MPGPILPIAGSLLPAALIWLGLRRWPLAAGVSGALAALLLRFLVAAIPLQESAGAVFPFVGAEWPLAGRALVLTEEVRQVLLLLYAGAALLFLFSALWPQGPDFVPAGLGALAPLAVLLLAQPSAFGIVALLVAVALVTIMIQAGDSNATTASLRFLVLMALTLPLFLLAGWMVESEQFVFVGTIWRLLLVGLTLWLAGFPFHIWVRPLLHKAPLLVTVYVLTLLQLVLAAFAHRLLQQAPALWESTRLFPLLRASAAATLLVAGLLALQARRPRDLLAYLLLADMGTLLLTLTFAGAGRPATVQIVQLRFAGLLLVAAGTFLLPGLLDADTFGALRARARDAPWRAALFAYGALSLAGLPLTPGFLGRWAAVSLLARLSPWPALLVLLATAAAIVAVLRSLAAWLAPPVAGLSNEEVGLD